MTGDVDVAGAAAVIHRSTDWLRRNWRTLTHPATGAAFPQPFVGAEPRGRPWWRRAAIEAWKDGLAQAPAAPPRAQTAADFGQRLPPLPPELWRGPAEVEDMRAAANDARRRPLSDRAAALRDAAGG